MTADGEINDHQARCQPYLLELLMLARVEVGLAPTAAEVSRATREPPATPCWPAGLAGRTRAPDHSFRSG
jgi:hypothetical protein